MSENSATCANCRLLLPLPLPPRRPPLASTNSGPEPSSKNTNANRKSGMSSERNNDSLPNRLPLAERSGAGVVAEENEWQRKAKGKGRRRKNRNKPCSSPSSGSKKGNGASGGTKRRCPAESIRHILLKWPMLGNLLHPAFRRYAKRSFRRSTLLTTTPSSSPLLSPSSSSSSSSSGKRPLPSASSASSSSASSSASPKRRLALRLQHRSLRYPPLPRLPAFQCPKCTLSTRRPHVVLNHICAKRPPEYKNVAQVVELGFRSRVKDALAVMERMAHPQAMKIGKLQERREKEAEELEQYNQPKALCEIAMRCVQRVHAAGRGLTLVQTQERRSPCVLEAHGPSTEKVSSSSPAFFCPKCHRLFENYANWDEHLMDDEQGQEDGGCPYTGQQPMEVEIPLGDALEVTALIEANLQPEGPSAEWRCTKCAAENGPSFSSRAEFHAHLMRCALNRKDGEQPTDRSEWD